MTTPRILFWIFALFFVLGGSLITITRRNAVSAVMALVGTFFGLAVVYVLLAAHFLAALQVLVYAGAIMTLFVFVVMVLNREEIDPLSRRGLFGHIIGVSLGIGGAAWLGYYLVDWQPPSTAGELPADWGGVANVGEVLFRDYLFPFETVSLLLLVAVIAAVVVARSPRPVTAAAVEPEPEDDAAAGDVH